MQRSWRVVDTTREDKRPVLGDVRAGTPCRIHSQNLCGHEDDWIVRFSIRGCEVDVAIAGGIKGI